MDNYVQYNLVGISYEAFVTFLFDHEVIPIPRDSKSNIEPWYWHAEVEYDAPTIANYYIQLFTEPQFLLSRFSKEQLEQGFWAIPNCNIECSVTEIIWNKHIPFEIRKNCVVSMFHLFENFFDLEPLDTSSNMWWDALTYDWCCGNRSRENGGEDEWMQDAMYETLAKILGLSSIECQYAALHGLGHLQHPDTVQLINQYLEKNKTIDSDLREYALEAAHFDVM